MGSPRRFREMDCLILLLHDDCIGRTVCIDKPSNEFLAVLFGDFVAADFVSDFSVAAPCDDMEIIPFEKIILNVRTRVDDVQYGNYAYLFHDYLHLQVKISAARDFHAAARFAHIGRLTMLRACSAMYDARARLLSASSNEDATNGSKPFTIMANFMMIKNDAWYSCPYHAPFL